MVELIFWLSSGMIFYTYFGYLGICLALAGLFRRSVEKRDIFPSISIIVPCYNEERVIRKKLNNLLALDYPKDKLQLMIASESNDKTNQIVSGYLDKAIELYVYKERKGKTTLIYNTVPYAKGEILVFSDANVIIKQDALKKIARNFYDEHIGAVTCLLVVDNPKASAISWGESLYKKYETVLRKTNSVLMRVLNPDGALFAIRRKLYNPINKERGDDFELVIRVLLGGYGSVFEPEAVSYEGAQVITCSEKKRKIRMTSWFLISALRLSGEMLLKLRIDLLLQIISHKFLRWFTPYFFILLLISNLMLWRDGLFFQLTAAAQLILYLLGLYGLYQQEIKRKKSASIVIKIAHYFLMYNFAFLIGTWVGILNRNTSGPWDKVR